MMGEGFGINPTEGEVVSPVAEKLIMFSNKTCNWFKTKMVLKF